MKKFFTKSNEGKDHHTRPNKKNEGRKNNETAPSNVLSAELEKPEDKSHESNNATASTQSSFLKVKRLKEIAQQDENAIKELKGNALFEDPHFEYFTQPLSNEIPFDSANIDTYILWHRPKELVDNPTIGMNNIKPDEVIQGYLGDCWFIAALGAVASYPVLFKKFFTEELPLYGENYKGYVKVRFWQYGEWVDIYIDDKLPTRKLELIYGRCKTKSNFWVPLLEKAYAKLMGSYENMTGGRSERALIDLTGGIYLIFEAGKFDSLADRYRFEDELSNSSLIGCVARRYETDVGNDGHGYSLLRINDFYVDKKVIRIYTLQNPQGRANELSRLESRDPIWSKLNADAKTKVLYDEKDILTWVNAESMKKFFSTVELMYYIPGLTKQDVPQQGYLFEFTEKWKDEDQYKLFTDKLPNYPHYLLHVISDDVANVMVNLLQDEIVVNKFYSITVFIFKVKNSNNDANEKVIGDIHYTNIRKGVNCSNGREDAFEKELSSGYYVMVPHVSSFDLKELAYLFRVYSKKQINVEKLTWDTLQFKFVTSDMQYVNVLTLRCIKCKKLITDENYKGNRNNHPYHKDQADCRKSIDSCDTCNKESNYKTFVTKHGITECKDCQKVGKLRNNLANHRHPSIPEE